MDDDVITQAIELPGGTIRLSEPRESAELPDDGGVEWAPLVPYWSVLWRSGVALARELATRDLHGLRVVEIGCGLGLPSIVAARGGADVLATDAEPEALELLAHNAAANGVLLRTATVDWTDPDTHPRRDGFDLALAADVLYDPVAAPAALSLLASLAPRAWLADPGRPRGAELLRSLPDLTEIEARQRGVVCIRLLAGNGRPPGDAAGG